MNLGPAELVIVLLIALLLFGGKKLPDLARSLGEAQKEFRRGTEEATTAGAVTDAGPSPVGTTDQPPTAAEPSTDDAPPTDRVAGEPTATNAPTDPSADG